MYVCMYLWHGCNVEVCQQPSQHIYQFWTQIYFLWINLHVLAYVCMYTIYHIHREEGKGGSWERDRE